MTSWFPITDTDEKLLIVGHQALIQTMIDLLLLPFSPSE